MKCWFVSQAELSGDTAPEVQNTLRKATASSSSLHHANQLARERPEGVNYTVNSLPEALGDDRAELAVVQTAIVDDYVDTAVWSDPRPWLFLALTGEGYFSAEPATALGPGGESAR